MITRGVAAWNQVRRCFSPTEWFVRWFQLPKPTVLAEDRGLVLIQIDGLSQSQLKRAIDSGRMPFLESLLQRENYQMRDLYSGLPASTPSVQGEMFYGAKCAVPAFGFRDHRTGELVRMFARDVAADVEDRISENSTGLLKGGSAYCNIYGGGAEEVHFCASSLGWGEFLQSIGGWKWIPFLSWHMGSVFRVVGLLLVEFVLACLSFIKGAVTKQEYWQELLMIPARVVVVILMRELAIIGASMDVTRGLPVVHLNLLGYDEQAHRRGPESRFAHWTLKGIDRAMLRLWRMAHRSPLREYDVWVYSDHGQITTTPYEYVAGQTLEEAAVEVIREVCGDSSTRGLDSATADGSAYDVGVMANQTPRKRACQPETRANWLSTGWIVGKLFGESERTASGVTDCVQVAALGPLGLVYSNCELSWDQKQRIALRLVAERGVPLAFITNGSDVVGIHAGGQFDLRQEPQAVFGKRHPFLAEIATDMRRLCHHPDAGDIVASGWVREGASLSFAVQSGGHAGPSPEETHAFVMTPKDVSFECRQRYLRPNDLRLAIRRFFDTEQPKLASELWGAPYQELRVMTYNVHACVGMDNRLDVRRIARVIAQSQADVVALQELDVSRARSGFRDQAQEVARMLEMQCQFHPAWRLEEECYGDAILSRVPMRLIQTGRLPSRNERYEPRGAIWVEIEPAIGLKVQVINTHLSLYPTERNLQAASLADWIHAAKEQGATVVCGDFNAQPRSPTYRSISNVAVDVQSYGARSKPSPTFFSPRPLARIDHIFVTDDVIVEDARVLDSRLASVASDHLPLVADLVLSQPRNTQ